MSTHEPRVVYEFPGFRLDPRRRVLTRAEGDTVALKAKVFDTLLYLVEHNGELVDKQTLMQAVWGRLVVEEGNLNKNISVLRQALGETPEDHRFIVTEPGRGYRFVADVRRVAANAEPEAAGEGAAAAQSESDVPSHMSVGVSSRASAATTRTATVAALGVMAALAILAGAWVLKPSQRAQELRLDITTSETIDPWSIAIAPDARAVAFVALSDGRSMLWLRPLDADRARPIAGTDGATWPFWSPDGRFIGFFANGYVQQVDLAGGSVQRVAVATSGQGGTWNRDGTLLFAPNRSSAIVSISAPGAAPTPVTQLERPQQQGHSAPAFLPDGRTFLFFVQGTPETRGVYAARLGEAGARRLLDADAKAVYVPPGFLLFVRQTTLYAQRFDADRAELSGAPFVVAENVMADQGPNWTALAASAAGAFAYRLGAVPESQLVWFDRGGRRLGTVGEPHRPAAWSPSISPDERQVAVYRAIGGNTDVWLLDTDRGVPSRLTFDPAFDNTPIWSPDGASIAYASNRTGSLDLYRKTMDGEGSDELLLASNSNKVPNAWSPDGRHLIYRVTGDESRYDIYAMSMDAERRSFGVATTSFDERDAQFSPDGKWIAYQSNESGQFEIYLQPFPGPGRKTLISSAGGTQVRFGPDGRELFYVALDGQLMSVALELDEVGATVRAGEPTPLFATRLRGGAVQIVDVAQYAVSHDGSRFLMNVDVAPASSSITVVLNWMPRD